MDIFDEKRYDLSFLLRPGAERHPTPEVVVFLPDRGREAEPIDPEPWIDAVITLFCDHFEGASELRVGGHYVAAGGRRIREETCRIAAFYDPAVLEAAMRELFPLLARFRRDTNQETVLLVLNGYAFFLSADDLDQWLE